MALAAHPMAPRVARVRASKRESASVWTLEIEDAAAPPATAGQFNMLTAFGVGETAISLSGDPADRSRLMHTIRVVGPVSGALAALREGEPIGVRGPFGAGWPLEAAEGRDVVILAGGLGLAPLRPALYRLMAERERYGRIVLYYGARSPEDILFGEELSAWAARGGVEVEITVDYAEPGWHGHVGVVPHLLDHVVLAPERCIAFVCGPEIMMRFSIAALRHAGLGDEAIHLSMERNMKCAIGLCGHCQFGPVFVCRDGPVFSHDRVAHLLTRKEI